MEPHHSYDRSDTIRPFEADPDGGVTIDDLLYYLGLYAAGAPGADMDDGSSLALPDGGVTVDDLLFYLTHYAGAC